MNDNELTFWESVKDYDKEINSIWINDNDKILEKIINTKDRKKQVCLDLGCGSGNSFRYLKEFKQVYGVDFSKNMLNLAKKQIEPNVKLIHSKIEEFNFDKPKPDVIFSINSIFPNNFSHFIEIITNVKKISKIGGEIYILLPSFEYYTFNYQLQIEKKFNETQNKNGEVNQLLNKILIEKNYSPLGYSTNNKGRIQKRWIKEEIEYQFEKYFKNISVEKFEIDIKELKKPFNKRWYWLVKIVNN